MLTGCPVRARYSKEASGLSLDSVLDRHRLAGRIAKRKNRLRPLPAELFEDPEVIEALTPRLSDPPRSPVQTPSPQPGVDFPPSSPPMRSPPALGTDESGRYISLVSDSDPLFMHNR